MLIRDEFPTLWQRPQKSLDVLDFLHLRHKLVKQRRQTANRLQALAYERGLAKGRMDSKLFRATLEAVEFGDAINAMLAASAFNFKSWMRKALAEAIFVRIYINEKWQEISNQSKLTQSF